MNYAALLIVTIGLFAGLCASSSSQNDLCASSALQNTSIAAPGLCSLSACNAEMEELQNEQYITIEGASRCAEGIAIISEQECRDAIEYLGLDVLTVVYKNEGIAGPNVYMRNGSTWPLGCSYYRDRVSGPSPFGVFNSHEAGRGSEHSTLICRTAVWAPPAHAVTTFLPKIGATYVRLEGKDGHGGCRRGSEVTTAHECAAALDSLELEYQNVIEDQQTYRPSGCTYFRADGMHSNRPKRGLFNTWKMGRADDLFDLICREVEPLAATTPSATTPAVMTPAATTTPPVVVAAAMLKMMRLEVESSEAQSETDIGIKDTRTTMNASTTELLNEDEEMEMGAVEEDFARFPSILHMSLIPFA